MVWDTPENVEKVKNTLEHVLNGCRCRTGCTTRRCRCMKAAKNCGPGCQCVGCANTVASVPDEVQNLDEDDLRIIEDDDLSTEASDDESDIESLDPQMVFALSDSSASESEDNYV